MLTLDTNAYLERRENRLHDSMDEYLNDEDFEALAAAILSHLESEYKFHSERCGKLKRTLELLQTGNIQ